MSIPLSKQVFVWDLACLLTFRLQVFLFFVGGLMALPCLSTFRSFCFLLVVLIGQSSGPVHSTCGSVQFLDQFYSNESKIDPIDPIDPDQ